MRTARRRATAAVLGAVFALAAAACGGGTDTGTGETPPPVPPARELTPETPAADPSGSPDGSAEESEDEAGKDPRNEEGVEVSAAAGDLPLPAVAAVSCPRATVTVGSSAELTAALGDAQPGQVILLKDATYEGNFVAATSGSATAPIHLCGGRGAVLDGGDVENGYVLHLDGATHWRLLGFTVRNGQKGVMADGTVGSVIQGLSVSGIGDEAVHLRGHSTDNLVIDNEISDTGNRKDKFGEGVYVGSAVSNWCTITDCLPDRSDRNVIARNTIRDTTSEAVDIKEGTTGGLLVDNTFDGARTEAADSWVDVKGTAWTIRGNRGTNAPLDGFQTHQIEDRWGERNLFEGNTISGAARTDDKGKPGYGIAVRPVAGNIVRCSNSASGGIEQANVGCT